MRLFNVFSYLSNSPLCNSIIFLSSLTLLSFNFSSNFVNSCPPRGSSGDFNPLPLTRAFGPSSCFSLVTLFFRCGEAVTLLPLAFNASSPSSIFLLVLHVAFLSKAGRPIAVIPWPGLSTPTRRGMSARLIVCLFSFSICLARTLLNMNTRVQSEKAVRLSPTSLCRFLRVPHCYSPLFHLLLFPLTTVHPHHFSSSWDERGRRGRARGGRREAGGPEA
mmetsp:Transcript_43522/g.113324  ORF Transcript_43522/g.113324 Transcript_43522/m.113324 type:complete len:219 (-) Transcript_43522:9-665(-)